MWFKNLQVYRLPARWAMTADKLAPMLAPHTFTPLGDLESLRHGWASPREDGALVHVVNKQMLVVLHTEKKVLPGAAVATAVKKRRDEVEASQGFAPGKLQTREIKERVIDEMLPRAFITPTNTFAWIDPVNGWLVVDASSPSRADDVVKLLLKAVDKMPLESLRVQRSPVATMTAWLEMDEAPVGFTVDQSATLRATGESRATVTYKLHTLDVGEMRRHIAAGKQCTRLAMTWNDRVSFVLTESLAIKSVKPLDVIKESDTATRDDAERFDNDMVLMTGELNNLLADLVEALGGEPDRDEPAAADADNSDFF